MTNSIMVDAVSNNKRNKLNEINVKYWRIFQVFVRKLNNLCSMARIRQKAEQGFHQFPVLFKAPLTDVLLKSLSRSSLILVH